MLLLRLRLPSKALSVLIKSKHGKAGQKAEYSKLWQDKATLVIQLLGSLVLIVMPRDASVTSGSHLLKPSVTFQ